MTEAQQREIENAIESQFSGSVPRFVAPQNIISYPSPSYSPNYRSQPSIDAQTSVKTQIRFLNLLSGVIPAWSILSKSRKLWGRWHRALLRAMNCATFALSSTQMTLIGVSLRATSCFRASRYPLLVGNRTGTRITVKCTPSAFTSKYSIVFVGKKSWSSEFCTATRFVFALICVKNLNITSVKCCRVQGIKSRK